MTTIKTNLSQEDILLLDADPEASVEILDVIQLVTNNASITRITAKIQNDLVEVNGTARRSPGDKPNRIIGEMLATARAYASLAKTIERRARGLVEHHADIQVQRPIQREKSEKYKAAILAVASSDDKIQRAALKQVREQEGSWTPNPVVTPSVFQGKAAFHAESGT